ncbi:hypothetical protein QVD17_38552 [Tagetes erecta]|uniref:Uncharacterized protein n=1 Tax=Tagetes erecta TaxID=13708 RepID=A0AAD8JM06_TARER|nr:hypothetical protein QVD17_38552 [Tagetes erecta]
MLMWILIDSFSSILNVNDGLKLCVEFRISSISCSLKMCIESALLIYDDDFNADVLYPNRNSVKKNL